MLHGDVTYGQGLSGWVALHRQALLTNTAQLDPRAIRIPGTPSVPEAAIAIPLIATGSLKDVLVVRREGYDVAFTETEFALARSFADLIAIALDNADLRVRLEQQASTDPLTGLPNRRYFSEALGVRARTVHEEGGTLSVLLIDVDGLKLTNDTLAIMKAIGCSRRLRKRSQQGCGRATWRRGLPATSSPSCSRTPTGPGRAPSHGALRTRSTMLRK